LVAVARHLPYHGALSNPSTNAEGLSAGGQGEDPKEEAAVSEMLTIIAHARAKPGKEAQAREILQALVVPTRLEEGCIDYDLHQSAEDPSSFVFYENWTSPEALEAHAKSPHITHFRSICAESLLEPPVLSKWKLLP